MLHPVALTECLINHFVPIDLTGIMNLVVVEALRLLEKENPGSLLDGGREVAEGDDGGEKCDPAENRSRNGRGRAVNLGHEALTIQQQLMETKVNATGKEHGLCK